MDAAALVALARLGSGRVIHALDGAPPQADEHAYVFPNGDVLISDPPERVDHSVRDGAVLSAPLNAENTASERALTEALLKSRIKVEGPDVRGVFTAWIGVAEAHGYSEAEAVSALLDALLDEVTAP